MAADKASSPRRRKTKAEREAASAGLIPYDVSGSLDAPHTKAQSTRAGAKVEMPDAAGSIPALVWGESRLPLLRTSERTTFKRCHWLWQLEFVQMRKPIYDTPALMLGSMVHLALKDYYKKGVRRGPLPALTFERVVEEEAVRVAGLMEMSVSSLYDQWGPSIELGLAMLKHYVEHWGKDDEWKVLATEIPFQVIVHHPRRGGRPIVPWFYYTGILDLVMENRATGKKMLWDHKTAKAITTRYLALDEQTTSYWTWGVEALKKRGIIGPKEQIDGLMFNFLRKAAPDDRPYKEVGGRRYYLNRPTKANPEGEISKVQPSPYFVREPVWRHSLQMEKSRARAVAEFEDMQRVRYDPERLAYKNNGKFTCAGCWAIDICELDEVGSDTRDMIERTTRSWDPYESHEIYFAEAK